MRVLIQCGDHFENQVRIKTLVKELLCFGHEPYVLVYNNHHGRLLLNAGAKIITLNNYMNKLDILSPKSLNEELDFGIKYADIIEFEQLRRPMIMWPGQIKKTLQSIKRHYAAIKKIIKKYKPGFIFVWNGYTGYTANILRIYADRFGIPTAYMERGILKDSLFVDSDGVNGASSLSNLSPKYLDSIDLSEEEYACIQKIFAPTKPKKIQKIQKIFFPLQVQRDTNIVMYSRFSSMREAFWEIYNKFNRNGVKFLLRPHPEEEKDTCLNIPLFKNTLVSSDKTLKEWLKWSDIVVTINSTVGLEAIIAGKPVISMGDSIYSSTGLTFGLNDNIKTFEPDEIYQRLFRYLKYLLSHNILIADKESNRDVIKKCMGFQNETYNKERLQIKPYMINSIDFADIYLDIPLDACVNVTYRDHKKAIDAAWIKKVISQNAGIANCAIHSVEHFDKSSNFSIKVVPESLNIKRDFNYDMTIDVYGNIIR
jgi:capsular polysaccharide export protein